MTAAQHTPGPWRIDRQEISASIYGPDNELVVAGEFDGWGCPFGCRDEGLSNARLIAAAPELLEALEFAYGHNLYLLGAEHPIVIKVSAAITKARGQ